MKKDTKKTKPAAVPPVKGSAPAKAPKNVPMAEVGSMLRHAAQKGFEAGVNAAKRMGGGQPAPARAPMMGMPMPLRQAGPPTPPRGLQQAGAPSRLGQGLGQQGGRDPRAVLALLQRLKAGR